MAKIGKNVIRVTSSVSDGTADIRIVDYIGDYDNDGTSIRAVVDDLLSKNITKAAVYINSQGGSVFDATEMANQLARFASVKITVGALAASAATYLTSKFYSIASPNSQFMIHKPSMFFSGNAQEVDGQLKLLNNITEDYKSVYAAKTGMTVEEIDALWSNGDYWMNASEALAKGFIDEVIVASIEIDDNDLSLLRACGAPVVPAITNTKTQISNMERLQLVAALSLPADATDEQINAKLSEYKIKAAALDAAKSNEAKLKKERATALVDRAILGKKITAEQKDTYVSLATDNYDAVASLLETTPSIPQLSSQLNMTDAGDPKANWTMEDWQEKDPEGLTAMFDTDRPKFEALQAAYAKKK